MFQINKINLLFNCQLCHKVLEYPVSLPCGETVCRAHTEQLSQAKCIFCSEIHKAPKNRFPANKIVQNQLEMKVNKINQNFSQFNDYQKIIEDLNKKLKETESIRQDPEYFIDEYFGELIRQVDLRRETLIEDIHQYSSGLIQKIEKLKHESVANSKKATKVTESIDSIKAKLTQLNSMFDCLEMDDLKHEEIMSQKESKEVGELIEPVLEKYKLELQGNKYYKLNTSDVKLEDVFGTLSCTDYDSEKMKVYIK